MSYTTFKYEFEAEPAATIAIHDLLRPRGSGTDNTTATTAASTSSSSSAPAPLAAARGKAGQCYDCSKIVYVVKVTNTGTVAGDAVVLGFASSKTVAPNATRWLFDFGRAEAVAPGASATVVLHFDGGCKQAVSTVDAGGARWLVPGEYQVSAGDIAAPATHALRVTGMAAQVDPTCPL